jgi:two-component system cell cycle sensor histidine kinase/response regulator CckA
MYTARNPGGLLRLAARGSRRCSRKNREWHRLRRASHFWEWRHSCFSNSQEQRLLSGYMNAGRVFGKRILVADDEPWVRDVLKVLLTIDHHKVTEARDGVEAFDLVSREQFDLLITDYQMPRMRGNELAAKVKKLPSSPRILMMTAYAQGLNPRDNPIDALLSKPFDFEELREAIAQLLS